MRKEIGIGLMGLGVVGGGVFTALREKGEILARKVGCPLILRKVLVRDLQKPRPFPIDPSLLTTNPQEVLSNPEVDIIIEVIGGESPAREYIEEALLKGKYVVTANKAVIAKYGPSLFSLAAEKGVEIRFEASVGGGIPLISPFQEDLAPNKITAIHAIINGTTNYILCRMGSDGLDFPTALKQAQELGYAEPDPTYDIEGIDAAYKLAILASLAFHTYVHPQDVYYEGISRLSWKDFRYAKELGYTIKLLAIAKEREEGIEARVHPVLIPENYLLAKVDGAYNAVQVEGDLVGKVIFYGMGAGSLPTTSAILADLLDIARKIYKGIPPTSVKWERIKPIRPISQLITRYYFRMTVADRPGVLAQIAKILGDLQISIAAVIQKDADAVAGTAEIVLMTHPSLEASVQQALKQIEKLAVVKEISNFIRVEV